MADIQNLITENLDVWTAAIKKKSATGRGSSKKIELTGIKKLRELILELAVRGKLIPQDANDEPASVLLEKITDERKKLIVEKKIKKPKVLPEITEEEKPFKLPNAWEWRVFGELAQHNAGKTLDRGRNQGDLRDYLTTSNLYWGKFNLDGIKQMPFLETDLEKCLATRFDLLICEGGEAGRAAVWEEDYDICIQNHVHRARFYHGVNPYFAFLLLQKMSYTGEINNFRKGVAISNMSGKALSSIPFPVPPYHEQNRIVAKVDELMKLCDKLEQQTEDSIKAHQTLVEVLLNTLTNSVNAAEFQQNWQRIAEHFDTLFTTEHSIDQLKQTILQLAVMGKLVPQNPDDEPASVLLKKIAAEKAQLIADKKIKKQKPLSEITDEEKIISLPKKWEWCRLLNISKLITDGAHHTPTYTKKGVPFLSVKDMSSGSLSFSDTRFISQEQHEDLIKRCNPELGDILLTKIGTTGVPIRISVNREFSIFVSVALIKFFDEYIDGQYLVHLFSSPLVKQQSASGTQGVGNKNLVLKTIGAFYLPIPPLKEQKRIVAKVDELMTLCDQLKTNIQQNQNTKVLLAETLVKQGLN